MAIKRFKTSNFDDDNSYQLFSGKKIKRSGIISNGTSETINNLRVRRFTSVGSNTLSITSSGIFDIHIWGGGGGGGFSGSGTGGSGGYAFGTVELFSNQTVIAFVGGGGDTRNANAGPGTAAAGGGGVCGNLGYGGNGGGYSGIFIDSVIMANAILMAGGGGGASWESRSGGAGGGTSGVSGGAGSNGSPGGGSGSSGGSGVGGAGSGSALQGGNCGASGDSGGGGAGGGGYFGGGAGSGNATGDGGGGGSGYASHLLISSTLTSGSGRVPPQISSEFYTGSYGYGGAAGANVGQPGMIVIVSRDIYSY